MKRFLIAVATISAVALAGHPAAAVLAPRVPEVAKPLPAGWGYAVARIEAVPTVRPAEVSSGFAHGSGGWGSCTSGPVHDLIVESFGAEANNALNVASRETGGRCNADARNTDSWPTGSGCHASGIFQILRDEGGGNGTPCDNWTSWSSSCGFAGASVFDAYANVKVAACIQARYGWGTGTWPL